MSATPINDGGPAFPVPDTVHPSGQVQYGYNGMSLRDWFAGQALVGEMASQSPEVGEYRDDCSNVILQSRARLLWRFADAMLATRNENQTAGGAK